MGLIIFIICLVCLFESLALMSVIYGEIIDAIHKLNEED